MDSFDRALAAKSEDEMVNQFIEGFEGIRTQLSDLLVRHGIKEMESLDTDFDPELHDALYYRDTADAEDGRIIEVIEKGYWINDKVLRHAKVGVARNK